MDEVLIEKSAEMIPLEKGLGKIGVEKIVRHVVACIGLLMLSPLAVGVCVMGYIVRAVDRVHDWCGERVERALDRMISLTDAPCADDRSCCDYD